MRSVVGALLLAHENMELYTLSWVVDRVHHLEHRVRYTDQEDRVRSEDDNIVLNARNSQRRLTAPWGIPEPRRKHAKAMPLLARRWHAISNIAVLPLLRTSREFIFKSPLRFGASAIAA